MLIRGSRRVFPQAGINGRKKRQKIGMATVNCCKCKEDKEVIAGMTYGGPIGDELKRRICNTCWLDWFNGFGVKVINEMQLNMRDPKHATMLMDQMRLYLTMPKEEEG